MLLGVVDYVRKFLKQDKIDWQDKRWKRNLYSPPELQQQIDGWACGLFLMMGMKALTKRTRLDGVKEDAKDEMRLEALEALINLL